MSKKHTRQKKPIASAKPPQLEEGTSHRDLGRIVRAALIALVVIIVALLAIHPLNSYDVWTHLATGRLVWEEKRIPDQEPYSYTQNREMTLEEAAPQFAILRTVFKRDGRLVVPAGTPFDDDCKAKLKKANVPLERVKIKLEPPLKRLVDDAVDENGNVIVPKGTVLDEEHTEKLRAAHIDKVNVTVPWVNHEWLFQVLAYLSYKRWGMSGAIYFKTVILMLAYFFVFLTVYRRSTHVIGLFAVFLAAMISYKRFYMRPEVFSILFTAVWLYLLERFRHRQKSWSICITMPLLMVVWINGHGYFILGPAIMLIYLIGEGIQGVVPMPRTLTRKLLWKQDVIRGRGWVILAVATVLSVMATFVNPSGVDGARYPIDVLGQVADPTSVIRTIIGEMQPPFHFSFTYAVIYTWVLLWLSGASWLLNIRRIKLSRVILYVVSIIFFSKALRNMPFLGIPGAVFMALNVNEAWDDTLGFLRRKIVPEALIVARWAGQAALAGLLVFFLIWIPSDRFYVYDIASIRYGLGYTKHKFSMGAVEWIRNHPVEGHLFNAFGMGGLSMWKLYPEKRPGPDGKPKDYYGGRRLFIDGRAEVYGGPFVKDYTRSLGDEPFARKLWKGLDDKFHFQVVFLNWQASDTNPLIARLYRDAEWALVYGDGVGYVFVRNTPANRAVIDEARRKLEAPRFVDFAETYGGLAAAMPGIPSRRKFAVAQEKIWTLAKILNADPSLADEARVVSDFPSQVQFNRRYQANGYDRFRERFLPWLPERVISPGEMTGRAGFALRAGRPDLAEAIIAGLIHLQDNVPEFYIHRAAVYQRRAEHLLGQGDRKRAESNFKMALEYYQEADRLSPDYPGLVLQLLRLCSRTGNTQLTSYYLDRALRDVYPTVRSSGVIGETCLKQNRVREALKQFEQALRLIPERESAPLYERIAFCYWKMRNFHRALLNVHRAIDLNPEFAGAYFRLGIILEALGRRAEAIAALERCLELDPNFGPARKQLERLRNLRRQPGTGLPRVPRRP